ncbi:sugar phosphate nucleotidyltransferase [uncultured Bacteroides sp.]|uniref:sugar phosphate nucleotidyltransferase n=1 Tax=uncultured Bacteroides sp. TaxID=162156 RepID=UPI002AAA7006|nr:sugar phosphate nucleotidyltransferase [uncultured Bacteroides sp.]
MKFAIISAGEGSRLAQEGVRLPKPLVPLNGLAMIDRLIDIFMKNDATSIAIIINNENIQTKEHLEKLKKRYPLEVIVKSTPGSMHSFYELMPLLKGDKFCLTTVDTIFNEAEFTAYIENFKASEDDGFMAVTDYVDDEKPLYIAANETLDITGYYDVKTPDCNYISGGIYCLTPSCLDTLQHCMDNGMTRMRQFQKTLVEEGKKLKAYPFSKILDVDHADDIAKAEAFLKEPFPIVGINRENRFSPNKAESDALIFNKVKENLEKKGFRVRTYTERHFIDQPMFAPVVFTMARSSMALDILDILEEENALIINSPKGIRNTGRLEMTTQLLSAEIPSPLSMILFTDKLVKEQDTPTYPYWIKRGDGHAQVKEDVCFVQTEQEASSVLQDFHNRGIKLAVINEHLEGDLIKFYGVTENNFFYWYYPSPTINSKFGLEAINGEAKGYKFSEEELKAYCEKASQKMGLSIYGGDCIVSPTGDIRIIDFNDWPSFAPCCEQAAEAIATLIVNKIKDGKRE